MTETTELFSIEQAVNYEGPDAVVHFTEYLAEKEKTAAKLKIFHSGFPTFDEAMGGLATGEVVVLTGHRKEGKTTFAESWMRSMLAQNSEAKSMILSYEMPPVQLLQKYKNDPGQPIYIPLSLEAGNFDWLYRRCLEAKYKYMANIVLIDHLDHMVDMSEKRNMAMNIGGFMRRLKFDIALKHNLAILIIAHQGQPKDDKEPSVDTLRGSSSIGQESDATITVMRRKNLNNVEIQDLGLRYGAEKVARVMPPDDADPFDEASANLAMIKIDCHRRTGVWKWKKLFRKVGDWMEEV